MMLLQIQELTQNELGQFVVNIKLPDKTSDKSFRATIDNPHDPKTQEQLEWYFEEYIHEPYTAETKVAKGKERIQQYGIELFQSLFANEAALQQYRELLKKGGFQELVFEITSLELSLGFQSLLWEALRDPEFPEEPLIAKGVRFYRKSAKASSFTSQVKKHPEINLLIVTARPNEEHDVDYRTIQRPLIDIIRRTPKLRVNAHILRPGTYEALKEHLMEKKSGFYHIVHFDLHGKVVDYDTLKEGRTEGSYRFSYNHSFGKPTKTFNVRYGREDITPFEGKKAFLFFETEESGIAEPTDAKELATLLQTYRIPACILNACQSAKQEGTTSETSLAKALYEHGINLVLAMRYSISVTAAKQLMERLYKELFNKKPIDEAISFGRMQLFNDKNRDATLGYKIELEDWVLPVIYKREAIDFRLRKLKKREKIARNHLRSKMANFPNLEFIGRDLDILKIEKLLLPPNNHLLLRGMIGVGKSTLLQYLSAWWTYTKFRSIQNAIYLDLRATPHTYEELIDTLALEVFEKKEYKGWEKEGLEYWRFELLDKFNANSYALILDNLFEFKDQRTIDLLSQINGLSFVVYGSVNSEEKLKPHTFKENCYQLDGLDKDAAYQLAGKIIREKANKKIKDLVEDNQFEFEHLLKLLAGFPSAMELVLPNLKDQTVGEVLTAFRGGTLNLKFNEI